MADWAITAALASQRQLRRLENSPQRVGRNTYGYVWYDNRRGRHTATFVSKYAQGSKEFVKLFLRSRASRKRRWIRLHGE